MAAGQQVLPGFVEPDYRHDQSIDERFDAFHEANPHVLAELERLADQLAAAGVRRFGVKALVERLRWDWTVQTAGDDFKVNNSFTSRYARLLIERRPDFADMIETRELRAA